MDYSEYFWQGEKVRLRPLSIDDAENVFVARFDSPSRQLLQLGIELPVSMEGIKESLAKYADCKEVDGVIIFTIEDDEGHNVGGISMHSRSRKNGTFSMGLIIDAPYRRRGYAEDAARILLRYCFDEQRYQKCNTACVDANTASIRLQKKLGFVEEGRRRRQFFLGGRFCDDILFGLTREEFDEHNKR